LKFDPLDQAVAHLSGFMYMLSGMTAANDMITHHLDPDALGHDEDWKGSSNAQGGLPYRG
jgi:hypothetical protein